MLCWAVLLVLPASGCDVPSKDPVSRAPGGSGTDGSGPAAPLKAAQIFTALAGSEPPEWAGSIEPGQTVQGSLGDGDGRLGDGSYYDAWALRVDRSGELDVIMASSEVESSVSLYRGEPGRPVSRVAFDGRAGGDRDARIAALVEPGSYIIVANSRGGVETGAYTLLIRSRGGAGLLSASGAASGDLSVSDEALGDSSRYDAWRYYGTAGERLSVTMTSTDFDPFLMLYAGGSDEGEFLAEDDDGGGFPDARISVTLPVSGLYTVVAGSAGAAATGDYALRVASAPPRAVSFDNTGPSGGRYALVVGIGDYPGAGSDLRAPVRDARAMADLLVGRFGFDRENVALLTDTDATRANLANGILQHLGQAGPDGVAVFFFSGLGTRMDADLGLTGAMDADSSRQGDGALVVHGYGDEASVLLDDELAYLLGALEAGRTVVVLDTSFEGESAGSTGSTDGPRPKWLRAADPEVAAFLRLPTDFIAAERGVASSRPAPPVFGPRPGAQRLVTWGAAATEQASWADEGEDGLSVFTRHLVARLAAAPATATLAEVHRHVADDVVRATGTDGRMTRQEPWIRGDDAVMTLEEFFSRR